MIGNGLMYNNGYGYVENNIIHINFHKIYITRNDNLYEIYIEFNDLTEPTGPIWWIKIILWFNVIDKKIWKCIIIV